MHGTPNYRQLVLHRMRTVGDTERLAIEWVRNVMAAMREASPPNPWIMVDEECLAAEILRSLTLKKKKQFSASRR